MFKKITKKISHAFDGLKHAVLFDIGFRTQVYLVIVLTFFVLLFLLPLTQTEFLFITLGYALVFITELQNSALEAALDKVHPEIHDNIKISKDMASAAVLGAVAFLFIVLIVIGLDRISIWT
ncbi:diacylglycerol kinase [Candidatus Nomurabacteria bacterium]|nr:diacylglycerol kinase [Candidatus Kaiserbacteria bacterium]MCB9815250.1 diacylglycerol kinase [Candidatus Nomurabacteria bacterium]